MAEVARKKAIRDAFLKAEAERQRQIAIEKAEKERDRL